LKISPLISHTKSPSFWNFPSLPFSSPFSPSYQTNAESLSSVTKWLEVWLVFYLKNIVTRIYIYIYIYIQKVKKDLIHLRHYTPYLIVIIGKDIHDSVIFKDKLVTSRILNHQVNQIIYNYIPYILDSSSWYCGVLFEEVKNCYEQILNLLLYVVPSW